MAADTEDLIKRFSTGPESELSAAISDRPLFTGNRALENFDDPLDDLNETKSDRLFPLDIPPTPKQSPHKSNIERLRGSPVKTPRRRFQAPVNTRAPLVSTHDNAGASPYSVSEFDENFDPLSVFKGNYSGTNTKDLNGYQTLLSSSTDKLTYELRLEKEKCAELRRELGASRAENLNANHWKSEADALREDNQNLKTRNISLEMQINQLQRSDRSESLVKENKLLREKLLKYKNLYDSFAKGTKVEQGVKRDTAPTLGDKIVPSTVTENSERVKEQDTNVSSRPILKNASVQTVHRNIAYDVPVPIAPTASQTTELLECLKQVLIGLESERVGNKCPKSCVGSHHVHRDFELPKPSQNHSQNSLNSDISKERDDNALGRSILKNPSVQSEGNVANNDPSPVPPAALQVSDLSDYLKQLLVALESERMLHESSKSPQHSQSFRDFEMSDAPQSNSQKSKESDRSDEISSGRPTLQRTSAQSKESIANNIPSPVPTDSLQFSELLENMKRVLIASDAKRVLNKSSKSTQSSQSCRELENSDAPRNNSQNSLDNDWSEEPNDNASGRSSVEGSPAQTKEKIGNIVPPPAPQTILQGSDFLEYLKEVLINLESQRNLNKSSQSSQSVQSHRELEKPNTPQNNSKMSLNSGSRKKRDGIASISPDLEYPSVQKVKENVENNLPAPQAALPVSDLLEYFKQVLVALVSEKSIKEPVKPNPSTQYSYKEVDTSVTPQNESQQTSLDRENDEKYLTKDPPLIASEHLSQVKCGENNTSINNSDERKKRSELADCEEQLETLENKKQEQSDYKEQVARLEKIEHIQPDCKGQFSRLEKILIDIQKDINSQNLVDKPLYHLPTEVKTSTASDANVDVHQCNCDILRTRNVSKQCSACSSVSTSGIPTRPQSESTPKGSDDTASLRGKFSWNRTV